MAEKRRRHTELVDPAGTNDRTVPGMRWIPGGTFTMGSEKHYPEEGPTRPVSVDGFWMDETPVTNQQFARFVAEARYITFAERPPNPRDYPNILPEMIRAGSAVFNRPVQKGTPGDLTQWWSFCFGACWRRPLGPGSGIKGLEYHPVVHVVDEDAKAYARWAGKSLPTEAEWEYAARGGLEGQDYAWGNELAPGGLMLANYWQGEFPTHNLMLDGFERTSPVRSFQPNGFGLYDMIGNVWEWTEDWYSDRHPHKQSNHCCSLKNPRGGAEAHSRDPLAPGIAIGRKVLCAPNYCQRYRPAARYPQPIDTSTSHVGFRCLLRTYNAAANNA
jgi:sulfatase modifying factor 1